MNSEAFKRHLQAQPREAAPPSTEWIHRLRNLDLPRETLVKDVVNSPEFQNLLIGLSLPKAQKATIKKLLGEAGFVFIKVGDAYRPSIGDIMMLTDELILKIPNVGQVGLKILRALFGSEDEEQMTDVEDWSI